ncbi:MAG: alpha/beta hydrolase [Acidobacteria bacterium]|nr:alpha/beta hydrolase [Acidobacteriota bacterium]
MSLPHLPALEDLEPTERGHFVAADGLRIAWVRWEHPNPVGRVLLSHGYGEHAERYRHTAAWLLRLGWSVSGLDHRGFGRSEGVRGDARGLGPFVEDFRQFLAAEGGAAPRRLVLAHSFGALVALCACLGAPTPVGGLVLSSPALVLRPFPWSIRLMERILLRLAPHLSLDLPNNKDLVCSDPRLVERYWADPLCHRRVTAAFPGVFPEGFKLLLEGAGDLRLPILVLEAGEDSVADHEAARALWARVPREGVERHRLAGFRHEIFHDRRRDEAQALVQAWMGRPFRVPSGNP